MCVFGDYIDMSEGKNGESEFEVILRLDTYYIERCVSGGELCV